MKHEIEIPEYSIDKGIQKIWERGYTIETKVNDNVIIIRANESGLISLACQFLTLAQKNTPAGFHLHYDDNNSLENGSSELIIQKF